MVTLCKVWPCGLYQVAIQAAIGGKIVARKSVSELRENVTGKVRRRHHPKRKLLEKQREGKRRMKSIGKINPESFRGRKRSSKS